MPDLRAITVLTDQAPPRGRHQVQRLDCKVIKVTCAGCGVMEGLEEHYHDGEDRGAYIQEEPWPSGRMWRNIQRAAYAMDSSWVCSPRCALAVTHEDLQGLWPDYQGGGWVMPTDTPGGVPKHPVAWPPFRPVIVRDRYAALVLWPPEDLALPRPLTLQDWEDFYQAVPILDLPPGATYWTAEGPRDPSGALVPLDPAQVTASKNAAAWSAWTPESDEPQPDEADPTPPVAVQEPEKVTIRLEGPDGHTWEVEGPPGRYRSRIRDPHDQAGAWGEWNVRPGHLEVPGPEGDPMEVLMATSAPEEAPVIHGTFQDLEDANPKPLVGT